ncbi:MAG: hypothetical protein HPY51_21205 [Candidatus Omnitrophica bacterium]|mgnify:CR=1 FL=1|jgi:hypothetical protein|nr:hypothetical protein [Candidatus Omnitrophota bacterium]
MNIDKLVRRFHEFLKSSMFLITEYSNEYLKNDWLQANWEILVESVLNDKNTGVFLEVYGDGADCNGYSSRVLFPDKSATHEIYCIPRNDKPIQDKVSLVDIHVNKLKYDRFVYWDGNKYSEMAPFGYVLLIDDKNNFYIIDINDIFFDIRPL